MRAPVKRLLTGCLMLGLVAAPGLALADDAVPPPPATAKTPAKPKAGPGVKPAVKAVAKPSAKTGVAVHPKDQAGAGQQKADPALAESPPGDKKARAKKTAGEKKPPAKRVATHGAGKARAVGGADLLLPQPEPMDTGLAIPVRKPAVQPLGQARASAQDLPMAGLPQAAFIPLPPERPPEMDRFDGNENRSGADESLQTASIAPPGPHGVNVSVDNLVPNGKTGGGGVDALIAKHAQRYGLPESLLRRVVKRESGGNPGLRHGPYLGLMQMRLDTARGMGYNGGANGLLDADTSLTYGAAYLANAWRVSGGNADRAVSLYAGGYYYEAKRKGMLPKLIKGKPDQ